MSGPRGSVFELLSVYCKPPGVQAEYWARAKRTHRLTLFPVRVDPSPSNSRRGVSGAERSIVGCVTSTAATTSR
jgi:hypothetical protein